MPAYNAERFISQSIDSVLAQTWKNWELIVIDDCSTDGTLEIIKRFSNDEPRIKALANSSNLGAAKTRNRAIEIASGEFLAFLDSDDLWHPKKLALQVGVMNNSDLDFLASDYSIIDENGELIGHMVSASGVSYRNLLKKNTIGCLTAIVRVTEPKKFMPDIRMRQDLGFWLAILENGGKGARLPLVTAEYRMHTGSMTSNKLKAAKYTWVLYRDFLDLSYLERVFYFLIYSTNGLLGLIRRKLFNKI